MSATSPAPRRSTIARFTGLLLVAAAVIGAPAAAFAQVQRPLPDEDAATFAVVSADNVYVRAGAGDSYYPFGKVHKGAVVKVVGEKHFWARVLTMGPAFKDFFGYVRYPRGESSRLRLENGGRTARTLGRVDLLAPNMNTDFRPTDSWKRILLLPADTTLDVLETMETERYTVFKVALPTTAEGWISTSFVTPATDAQVKAWKAALANPAAMARGAKPLKPGAAAGDASRVLAREEPAMDPIATLIVQPELDDPAFDVTPSELATDIIDDAMKPMLPPVTDPVRKPAPKRLHDSIRETAEATAQAPRPEPRPLETDRLVQPELAPPAADSLDPAVVVSAVKVIDEGPTPQTPAPASADRTAPAAARAVATTPVKGLAPTGTPRERLEALEVAYQLLRAEPIQNAEVLPLRQLYLGLVDDARGERTVARYAEARAEQLTIWADLQKRRAELDKLRKRVTLSAEEAEAVRLAQSTAGAYIAIGRLTASTIYDGRKLPRLFRVQDVDTGRTVAYLRPDKGFDLHSMLGQLVGVAGTKSYEGSLRLDIVEPLRIDLLATPASG